MRVAAVSDLHGHLPAVPACDLLLLGGDLCPKSDHSPARQAAWLDGPFRAWLDAAPAREVVAVAGNHDFVFEKVPGLVPAGLRWTYLQDSGCRVGPYNVWGSPWQPVFFDWASWHTSGLLPRR
jgi:3',5'-cyclic AMP phosphodiesterase CpdA